MQQYCLEHQEDKPPFNLGQNDSLIVDAQSRLGYCAQDNVADPTLGVNGGKFYNAFEMFGTAFHLAMHLKNKRKITFTLVRHPFER